tara:strand:- start:3637 stop:5544 length:1908 start_codon:yes stop_codon:yes gene_type:complete
VLSASGLGGKVCSACGGKFDSVAEEQALPKKTHLHYHTECASCAPAAARLGAVNAVPPASFAAAVMKQTTGLITLEMSWPSKGKAEAWDSKALFQLCLGPMSEADVLGVAAVDGGEKVAAADPWATIEEGASDGTPPEGGTPPQGALAALSLEDAAAAVASASVSTSTSTATSSSESAAAGAAAGAAPPLPSVDPRWGIGTEEQQSYVAAANGANLMRLSAVVGASSKKKNFQSVRLPFIPWGTNTSPDSKKAAKKLFAKTDDELLANLRIRHKTRDSPFCEVDWVVESTSSSSSGADEASSGTVPEPSSSAAAATASAAAPAQFSLAALRPHLVPVRLATSSPAAAVEKEGGESGDERERSLHLSLYKRAHGVVAVLDVVFVREFSMKRENVEGGKMCTRVTGSTFDASTGTYVLVLCTSTRLGYSTQDRHNIYYSLLTSCFRECGNIYIYIGLAIGGVRELAPCSGAKVPHLRLTGATITFTPDEGIVAAGGGRKSLSPRRRSKANGGGGRKSSLQLADEAAMAEKVAPVAYVLPDKTTKTGKTTTTTMAKKKKKKKSLSRKMSSLDIADAAREAAKHVPVAYALPKKKKKKKKKKKVEEGGGEELEEVKEAGQTADADADSNDPAVGTELIL